MRYISTGSPLIPQDMFSQRKINSVIFFLLQNNLKLFSTLLFTTKNNNNKTKKKDINNQLVFTQWWERTELKVNRRKPLVKGYTLC